MKTEIDVLIFDLDGTLVDSGRDLVTTANFTRQYYGKEQLHYEMIIRYVGDGLKKLIQRLFPDFSEIQCEEAKKVFIEYYRIHCVDYTRPYPGVLETLEYFDKKIKTVVTNKMNWATEQILRELGIIKYFALILGSESLSSLKPDPMPVFHILKQFSLSPKRAVIVGDGITDMQAGKRSGIYTCAVSYGMRAIEELQAIKPDFIINHFSELQNLFY